MNNTDAGSGSGHKGRRSKDDPGHDRGREFIANREEEHRRRVLLASRLQQALAGISAAKIAQRTGWSAETVRRYLQGKASPPATLLMVVAEELSVNPDFLLLGKGPVHREHRTTEPRPVPNRQVLDALYFLISQHEGSDNGRPPGPRSHH